MDTKNEQTKEESSLQWLLNRGISVDTIAKAGLVFLSNGEIQIPIKDASGKVVFNKYRRAPWLTTGPKYRYDAGSTAQLYGIETLAALPPRTTVVICEGELDALAIRTIGIPAVTSTGGAATWRPEWSELFGLLRPVIVYDADKAGVEGALRVREQIAHALIAWIPPVYGKDATDVIRAQNGPAIFKELLSRHSTHYTMPTQEIVGTERITTLGYLKNELEAEAIELSKDPYGSPLCPNLALNWVDNEIKKEYGYMTPKRQATAGKSEDVEKAKQYPIPEILKVNRDCFALCPAHKEDTPSMKYYPSDNHAYCFGCGKRFDSIDVYMAVHGCDFKTALKSLI